MSQAMAMQDTFIGNLAQQPAHVAHPTRLLSDINLPSITNQ